MRRTLVFIVLLLLLGVAMTIAVAWGFAAFEVTGGRWADVAWRTHNGWSVITGHAPGRRVLRVWDREDDYLDLDHVEASFAIPSWSTANTPLEEDELGRVEHAFGWPLHTMRYTYRLSYSQVPRDHYEGGWLVKPVGGIAAGGIVQATDAQMELRWALQIGAAGHTAMPLVPIGLPFVISTLMWAVVWWCATGAFFAPARLRRIVRRSRGQCANCGYPLEQITSDTCPECGWDQSQRATIVPISRMILAGVALVVLVVGTAAGSIYLASQFEHPHPMLVAAAHDDVEELARLIDEDQQLPAPFDANLSESLRWAIIARSEDAVDLLIERGANINVEHSAGSAIHAAAAYGNEGIFDTLIKAGADPASKNHSGWTPLHWAVHNRDGEEMVQAVLKHEVDINAVNLGGRTPLHHAVDQPGEQPTVSLLLERGAVVNTVDIYNLTPLLSAIRQGAVNHVRELLAAGADVSYEDPSGQQALHHVPYDRPAAAEIVQLLADAGACLDCVDTAMETPLHMALRAHNEDAVRVLLRAGAKPQISSGAGLLHVINWEQISDEFVRFLLDEIDLDINQPDANGDTPYDLARSRFGDETAQRLVELGARPSSSESAED